MTDSSQRDDVHVCELCGAWYETRKGLSSHARAHLRQFGVNIDSKGAPIDILHELLQKEEHINNFGDFTPSSTSPKHTSKFSPPSSPAPKERTSTHITPSPAKKLKISPVTAGMEALSEQPKGNSPKDVFCDFCHEKFKKSQSLASHARCHLRQLGVTEWTVQGSPMATLRELMARRGATSLPKPNASPTKHGDPSTVAHSSPFAPPNQADATPKKHHTSCTEPHVPPLQPETLLAKPLALPSKPVTTPSKSSALPTKPVPIHTKPSLSTALPPTPTTLPSVAPMTPSSNPAPLRVPKARKGSRMVVPRPKDEPVEREVSIIEPPKPKSTSTLLLKSPASNTEQTNTVPKAELDVSMSVRCDYCSEMFDSRKALSCHARAHLRQLGVKWSPNASPIDTLYKLLLREGKVTSPQSFTSSPVDVLREKTDPLDSMASGLEATCELCGFDFENRKALASHARAHLRQQGVDWHTNGSPIETLSEWMQREPAKVAELHRRYLQGELPQVVKRKTSSSSPHPSLSELELTRPPPVREFKSHPSTSSAHRKPSAPQHASTHASARGCERRPPKHLSHSQSRLGVEPVKRVGIVPSLMPRPPESSLVKLVGKIYSLKCRFCEEVFKGPLSVQEDWLIHLRQHILNLKRDSAHNSTPALQSPTPTVPHTDTVQLIDPDVK